VRFSIVCASAALAFGSALSACSGTSSTSPALPSAAAQALVMSHPVSGISTYPLRAVRRLATYCPRRYAFCINVTPGDPGPYLKTLGGTKLLYNNAYIETLKGKIDDNFQTYFDPTPGNPTSQYILFSGKMPKNWNRVEYSDYYCIGLFPHTCDNGAYTFIIGISIMAS
jgi:hypothetical protein